MHDYELCANGRVSYFCQHSFQYLILVHGNTECNFIVFIQWTWSQETIPIIYNLITEWLSDRVTLQKYSYIMNADTGHFGCWTVTYISLRFKLAYAYGICGENATKFNKLIIITELYNHYQNLILEHFHYSKKRNLVPINSSFSIASLPNPG